jgi:chemotaxis protein CheX
VIHYRALGREDIEVFSRAIGDYFETCTGRRAEVRTAYLLDPDAQPCLGNDYNGLIELSGAYAGSVCFSAPTSLLSHVLLASGESDFTDEKHADLVGEIANTLAGQARRHFGEQLGISTPRTFRRQEALPPADSQRHPFAIPLVWHGYAADLVVALNGRRGPAKTRQPD